MTSNVTTFWFASHEEARIFAITLQAHKIPAHLCDFHANRVINYAIDRYHSDIRVLIPSVFYEESKQIIKDCRAEGDRILHDEDTEQITPQSKWVVHTWIHLFSLLFGLNLPFLIMILWGYAFDNSSRIEYKNSLKSWFYGLLVAILIAAIIPLPGFIYSLYFLD